MPGSNLTTDEAQRRSDVLTVDTYDIALDLTAPGADTFRSVTAIGFSCSEPTEAVFLDLLAASVHEVRLNGRALPLDLAFQDSRIALPGLVAGHNEVTVIADCAYSRTGEGLHRFVDPVDDNTYLYTQFEVADARRVFACFDQPDLKARFRFTATVPDAWTVVSTMAPTSTRTVGGSSTAWSFDWTPRLSTYVVSLAAGPYHAVHSTHRDGERAIPLGLYCRQSLAAHLDPDDIFEVTRLGLNWFPERFDCPYPFGKYDQLFVPGFNAGAMENAAAVTFNEKYVFRSKATDAAYRKRAATILHELSHMWFGDLVTMTWWNDLWLNESFATYCSFACQALAPRSRWADSWTTFANHQKAKAYRQDQLPSTHPVVARIHDLEDVLVNFDGITYAKGASVLKQLVAYVGTDAFFGGVRDYLTTHAHENTRFHDLLEALEKASGRDLGTWSKLWLETAGVNVLRPETETDEDGVITSFRIRQEAPALPPGAAGEAVLRPHRVAVGFYSLDAGTHRLVRELRAEVDIAAQADTDVPELVGCRRPDVILLNDDDLTYAKLRFDEKSMRGVVEHLADFTDPLPRALCWAAAWDMTRDGELAARDYVRLVLSAIDAESDIGVVESLHRNVLHALTHYVAPEARAELTALWSQAALEYLRGTQPGSGHQLAWARAFVTSAWSGPQLDILTGLRDGTLRLPGLVLDSELRWAILLRLAVHGRIDEAEISAEERYDATPAGACHAASARAARPDPAAKSAAWTEVVERGELSNQIQRAVIAGFTTHTDPGVLAPYTHRYFAAIRGIWESRSHEMAKQVVLGLFPVAPDTRSVRDAAKHWLEYSDSAPAALRRLVQEQYDDVERALRAQRTDALRHSRSGGNGL
ncbi:aminopeptidase N [Streptomyces sp. PTM05]|uniref:Aminopeptidase N n=1 Tax=Streptantibioticus parmotrematis TaxID=2873249 RepID=A0ABS7QP76_9ACTN|nr:aminopeptidase N [Streptantibioticus parmotrematis]MBY8884733.1 aminopeptidase N [Streptantibioticus parmotrematis]